MILIDEEIVDWNGLRKQKLTLLEIRRKLKNYSIQDNALDHITGILHLIDHIQNMALASGVYNEEEIFGFKAD